MSKTKTKTKNRTVRQYKGTLLGTGICSTAVYRVLYFHGISNCICINCKYDKMEWYEQSC